jgi:hypothetical protein
VTWGNGNTGVSGIVSAANSLVGTNPGDEVGYGGGPLSDGDFVAYSPFWNSLRGAETWISGATGQSLDGLGIITPQNSLLGTVANAGYGEAIEDPIDQTFLVSFGTEVRVGFTNPNQLTYAAAQAQSLAISPDFLTRTLDTGTAVVLQASNDITVDTPITVSAGGKGGALTLEAGRSLVLNASITTDNGSLTLIANDPLANGVVDSQRDVGPAIISMAPGTELDTGSGPLTVELRNGSGLTNSESGAIALQRVIAGSVAVANDGRNAGSDVNLGSVTTTGVQSYADPNGITTVSGNLRAANPITFYDSVVLSGSAKGF